MKEILIIAISVMGEAVGFIIMLRILLSIFNLSYDNPLMRFAYALTEPILAPIRGLINSFFKRPVMLDFSPVIAWFLIDYLIVPLLIRFVNFIMI